LNKFLEFFRDLFGLSEEQVKKAEKELNNVEKLTENTEETTENQEVESEKSKINKKTEKTTETQTTEKNESEDDNLQSAVATSNTAEGVEETVNNEEYKKLQAELAAVKKILENTKAEQAKEKRDNKVKAVKDCLDYEYLTSLLDGVEDKDFDTKVEEIKKEKSYLFKTTDTKGFNPATPSSTLNGVEEAFFKNNPDLRTQL
jgi:small-conductance mechanosensitive channel